VPFFRCDYCKIVEGVEGEVMATNKEFVANKGIVFVLDDTYADPGRLAIRDVWTYSGSKYPIFIMHGANLSEGSKEKILKDFKHIGAPDDVIRFIDVSHKGDMFAGLNVTHAGEISYAKLLMGDLFWLPEKISTAYYFDVDILVVRDLTDLFEIVPKKALAAVDHLSNEDHVRLLGTDGIYHNAGVLVANLNRWATINALEKFQRAIQDHRRDIVHVDQDVFAIAFDDEFEELPIEYNFVNNGRFNPFFKKAEATDWEPAEISPAIVHFIGPEKPWHSGSWQFSSKQWRSRRKAL